MLKAIVIIGMTIWSYIEVGSAMYNKFAGIGGPFVASPAWLNLATDFVLSLVGLGAAAVSILFMMACMSWCVFALPIGLIENFRRDEVLAWLVGAYVAYNPSLQLPTFWLIWWTAIGGLVAWWFYISTKGDTTKSHAIA